jgi:hypothetical protein
MENIIFNDLFTKEECMELNLMVQHELENRPHVPILADKDGSLINQDDVVMIDQDNGRLMVEILPTPEYIVEKLKTIVREQYGDCEYISTVYAEYSSNTGNPKLNGHFDTKLDTTLIDYQLASNTKWPITVDGTNYELIDNQAVLLRPFKQYHGRPQKTFEKDEYVNMLFFFFQKPTNRE